MKRKRLSKKMVLNKETIVDLSSQEKTKIYGGWTMVCTGLTVCDTFCDASWYTECIETNCLGTHPRDCIY